ncbi:hypothetical protein OZX62_02160 [Bifidobacterium sp. ESL0690]|uniref:hypothetical protein n=1 Tax=Bifidobacterium sp. ESL0690 TaxID=2983214 RepID=UPI0023FA4837|nr:hypothetical protein [Bifidobacterium sp. ESL0690]WEV47119.1 hypothetical protein OZX62_02160 [Bifidobacterium sp. ESL0690]
MRNYFWNHPVVVAIVFALIMFGVDVIGVLVDIESVDVLLPSGIKAVIAAIIFYALTRWTATKFNK